MTKIYTKTGDNGTTGLLNGKRYSKDTKIFDVLGTLDELAAVLGYLHSSKKKKLVLVATGIQNDLFELGSFIAGKKITFEDIKRVEQKIKTVEQEIDELDSKNKPLKNFILAGGSQDSIKLHHSRVICRRAERMLVAFSKSKKLPKLAIFSIYLNRLSDYLFVLARYYNGLGKKDIIWKSGF